MGDFLLLQRFGSLQFTIKGTVLVALARPFASDVPGRCRGKSLPSATAARGHENFSQSTFKYTSERIQICCAHYDENEKVFTFLLGV